MANMYNNTIRIHRNTLYNNHTYTKAQVMITKIIICMHNVQTLITTITMHTQHKYLLQFKSDGEKDEFLKHF